MGEKYIRLWSCILAADLSPTQKLALAILADATDVPTQRELAAKVGCKQTALKAALRQLEEDGWISKTRNNGLTNAYHTHLDNGVPSRNTTRYPDGIRLGDPDGIRLGKLDPDGFRLGQDEQNGTIKTPKNTHLGELPTELPTGFPQDTGNDINYAVLADPHYLSKRLTTKVVNHSLERGTSSPSGRTPRPKKTDCPQPAFWATHEPELIAWVTTKVPGLSEVAARSWVRERVQEITLSAAASGYQYVNWLAAFKKWFGKPADLPRKTEQKAHSKAVPQQLWERVAAEEVGAIPVPDFWEGYGALPESALAGPLLGFEGQGRAKGRGS